MQKSISLSTGIILTSILLLFVVTPNFVFGEDEGSLEVFVKLPTGLRASPNDMVIKIYQDSNESPLQEIQIKSNPYTISSLPIGHTYKVEVYDHSIFAAFDLIKLDQENQNLDLTIPGTGSLDIVVLYNDKVTPIPNAGIEVFSFDGNPFTKTSTYLYGEAPRLYIPITNKDSDYFYVDIKLGEEITKRISPIHIHKGNQELKVITDWPPLVEDLVTVEVFDSLHVKFTNQKGYSMELIDGENKVVKKSDVNLKGWAYFSNFKVGEYTLVMKKTDPSGTHEISKMNVSLTGKQNSIIFNINDSKAEEPKIISVPYTEENPSKEPVKENVKEPEKEQTNKPEKEIKNNCNCVAFRFSNVQDFYLNEVQISLMNLFDSKNIPLTIGVSGDSIGEDSKITDAVKEKISKNDIVIATIGWDLVDLTTLSESDQVNNIKSANEKINDVFGIRPSIFFAPYSKFNENTVRAVQTNGMAYFSSSIGSDYPPKNFETSIPHHIPYTLSVKDVFLNDSTEETITESGIKKILNNLDEYGYSIINIQSQDFALRNDEGNQNAIDSEKLDNLSVLIDAIKANGISIVKLDEIPEKVTPRTTPHWIDAIYLMYEEGKIKHTDLELALNYMVAKNIIHIQGYNYVWN